MKTVFLVLRSGGDFTFDDVLLIGHNLHKNGAESIVCLYDQIMTPYITESIIFLPMPNHWKGWWAKMNIFSPEFEKFRPFLYLDLDTAIVGNLDDFFRDKYKDKFITLCDFYRRKKLASGVMWIPKNNKKVKFIWDNWRYGYGRAMLVYKGDQNYIESIVYADLFWQNITKKIITFKPINKREFWVEEIPENVSIVCFHGKPRIPQAAKEIKWVETYVSEALQV